MINEAIQRVKRMERIFDILQAGDDPQALRDLTAYYESGQWLRDYELDEQGLLPPDLKRGVLSQDALFNFLEESSCK